MFVSQLLVNILDAMGPIGVSGYGEYSTKIVPECNCPQVIYELESFADIEGPIVWSENEPGKIVFAPENYDNRKNNFYAWPLVFDRKRGKRYTRPAYRNARTII